MTTKNQMTNQIKIQNDGEVIYPEAGPYQLPADLQTHLPKILGTVPEDPLFLPNLLQVCEPGSWLVVREAAAQAGQELYAKWADLALHFHNVAGRRHWDRRSLTIVYERRVASWKIDNVLVCANGLKYVDFGGQLLSLREFEIEHGQGVLAHLQDVMDADRLRIQTIIHDLQAEIVSLTATVEFEDGTVGEAKLVGLKSVSPHDWPKPPKVKSILDFPT